MPQVRGEPWEIGNALAYYDLLPWRDYGGGQVRQSDTYTVAISKLWN
jgi:hypothetical protein